MLYLFVTAILALNVLKCNAANSDSLEYINQRTLFLQSSQYDSEADATAELLASSSFFIEALQLLRELMAGKTNYNYNEKNRYTEEIEKWKMSLGTDFYHLEDVDTAVMTTEELRDYQRLMRTPQSFWIRAKRKINTNRRFFSSFTPEVYISNNKAKAEISGSGKLSKALLSLNMNVRAEKWYPFISSNGSDLISCFLMATPDKIPLPISMDVVRYRLQKSGYESYNRYRLSPSLSNKKVLNNVYGSVEADVSFEDYSSPYDSMDILISRFFGDLSYLQRPINLTTTFLLHHEFYIKGKSRQFVISYEPAIKIEVKISKNIVSSSLLSTTNEIEKYSTHSLSGNELSLKQTVNYNITSEVTMSVGCLLEKRWSDYYDSIQPSFIWEAKSAIEPLLTFNLRLKKIDCFFTSSYCYEKIEEKFKSSYLDDNKAFRTGSEISIAISKKITVSLYADYQYKSYINSRQTENLSVSGQIYFLF
jgi:hypothetical protein